VVDPTVKINEEVPQHGMIHRFTGIVLDQIALGYIGLLILVMHQYVIPGLILWRACPRNLFVPGIASHKDRIHIHNHAAVVEQAVIDALPYGKFCLFHIQSHRQGKPYLIIYDTPARDKFAPAGWTRIITDFRQLHR